MIYAIFSKEFKSLVMRPSFFILLCICSFYFLVQFYSGLLRFEELSQGFQAQGGMSLTDYLLIPNISALNLILIFIVPFLVTRLFAEEEKMHTYELLLSSPVSSLQILLGKYFAACAMVSLVVLLNFLYPVSLMYQIQWQWAEMLCSFFTMILVASLYVALGLFASSLSSSTFISGILACLLNISLWLMSSLRSLAESPFWDQLFRDLWIGTHLNTLSHANLDLSSVFILFSFIFLFLYMTYQSLESKRWR